MTISIIFNFNSKIDRDLLLIFILYFSKKSGKVKTGYKMDYLNLNCDCDFDFAGPTINGSAVLG